MCAYVLVAEDEPRQAELIVRFLARENHSYLLVDDGRKALDEIRGRRPDLLVLDLMLPGVHGWDVCRAVRAEDADLPVLVQKQLEDARAQYNSLSASTRHALKNAGDMSAIQVPPGTAGKAVEFALQQRGDAFVFGSNGPDTWDCSSLIQAAYGHANVKIGRTSYDQAKAGRAVSRGEVRAGDIIVYCSTRSHVALAIDNVRAVHASTEGVPVKIADIDSIGPISVIRRIAD